MQLDHRPLTDTEIDERLRAALDALGYARGKTDNGHRVLEAVRKIIADAILQFMRSTMPTVELWPAQPSRPPRPRKPPRARKFKPRTKPEERPRN
jgi:hypothetical protein